MKSRRQTSSLRPATTSSASRSESSTVHVRAEGHDRHALGLEPVVVDGAPRRPVATSRSREPTSRAPPSRARVRSEATARRGSSTRDRSRPSRPRSRRSRRRSAARSRGTGSRASRPRTPSSCCRANPRRELGRIRLRDRGLPVSRVTTSQAEAKARLLGLEQELVLHLQGPERIELEAAVPRAPSRRRGTCRTTSERPRDRPS